MSQEGSGFQAFLPVPGLHADHPAGRGRGPGPDYEDGGRVRRDGQALEIDATELVPGDVVLMEAGSQVPADGRIWMAATLDIEEAALTGESLPVAKDTGRPPREEVPLVWHCPPSRTRDRRVRGNGGGDETFGVHSEVGRLRKVMVHRPELSLQRLTPSTHDELLFDDVLWVERAQYEHDQFVARMRERGVEVFVLRDLLAEALAASEEAAGGWSSWRRRNTPWGCRWWTRSARCWGT